MIWRWLHGRSIRTLLLVSVATIPVVVALFGVAFVRIALDVALDGEEERLVATTTRAVRVALALTVACACGAAVAVALLLWGSIRHLIRRMHDATVAIADGQFSHRISTTTRRDELGHLAYAIDSMAVRLEHLEQARRRVLACVSHELRTPLTIVRGHAFTLGRDERDPVRRDRFELIETEAERLAGLLTDLLDSATLHAGGVRLHRERSDLAARVEAALDRVDDAARAAEVTVRVDVDRRRLDLDLDPGRVDQVLANLLFNAVRHAPRHSEVRVRVRHDGAGFAVVEVANASEEIPAEVAASLFEPFVQHGSATGSVGLGLAIARDLVEAHGGQLDLVDRGEAGVVRFRMVLPAPPRIRGEQHVRSGAASRRLVEPGWA